jgi:SNF2 family DNA or RNA helicase
MNLPQGNILINYDSPWHSAALRQRDRIGRITSVWKHNYIYNYVTKDTVEKRIQDLVEYKLGLYNVVIKGDKGVVKGKESMTKFFRNNRRTHTWQADGTPTKSEERKWAS